MSVPAIVFSGALLLAAGYRFYGRLLERAVGVDPARPTPAVVRRDGADYVPSRPMVLLGHHFSSIAGAGPIVGPIIAAAAFGWMPAALWVVLGSIFIGGVQDFTALMASVRHGGHSVAELAREEVSPRARVLFLIFVWLALVYVIVVFVDLTATTFTTDPGVASSSLMYVVLAVALGLAVHRAGFGLGRASIVFVPLVFLAVLAGPSLPLELPFGGAGRAWSVLLLAYCFAASVLPVWILLQPRDYLSSFLLYACLGVGLAGILLGGGALPEDVVPLPALVTWNDADLGLLFPAMFITIACGACSGFHSIVASGTTAKQLASERHARPVAYGGMLLEGVLALLSIATVILMGGVAARATAPTVVFAEGLGRIAAAVGIPASLGVHFGALAVSTFLLTTLDTCTRLARYVVQELLGWQRGGRAGVAGATAASLALPLLLTQITLHQPDGTPAPAWKVVWPVFGATNQLLGALAMLAVTAWLVNQRRRYAFVAIPMAFMFTVTIVALAQLVWRYGLLTLVGGIAAALFALAMVLLAEVMRHFLRPAARLEAEAGSN